MPRIDGLVVCVGPVYREHLESSLSIWLKTLDSLTIVTNHEPNTWTTHPNLKIFTTDLFQKYGAAFNKGAALSAAINHLKPTDFVLNVDADIVPEPTWREECEHLLEPGYLHGADRYDKWGDKFHDWPFPCGYFHLWSVRDPAMWLRPVFPVCYTHAGNYDAAVLERWPEALRRDLRIKLIHLGEPRQNWFGITGEPSHDLEATAQMNKLKAMNLRTAFLEEAGKADVPRFKRRICIPTGPWERIQPVLDSFTDEDPFQFSVRVGNPIDGEEFIG